MSRTYRKAIKRGICTGSNTEYYRYMNRKCRAKNRHNLRNYMAKYDIETIAEEIPAAEHPIRDSWNEPTDGTILVTKKDKNSFEYNDDGSNIHNSHYGTGRNYWNHKYGKYLKTKH